MAKEEKQKFSIHIDGILYKVETSSISGAALKALAEKDQQYQLFLEGHGNSADEQIADDRSLELKNGMHFYTVPPATFG